MDTIAIHAVGLTVDINVGEYFYKTLTPCNATDLICWPNLLKGALVVLFCIIRLMPHFYSLLMHFDVLVPHFDVLVVFSATKKHEIKQ